MNYLSKLLTLLLAVAVIGCAKSPDEMNNPVKKSGTDIVLSQSTSTVVGSYSSGSGTITASPKSSITIGSTTYGLQTTEFVGEFTEGTAYYKATYVSTSGNSHVVGWPVDGPETTNCPSTSHSCTGDPCTDCDFTYDDNNCIDGCNCGTLINYDDKCNHAISTGIEPASVEYWL